MFRNNLNRQKIVTDFGEDNVRKFYYIKNWMTKETSGQYEGYEKYTFYWIAFNVFYNLKYFYENQNETIFDSGEMKRVLNSIANFDAIKKKDLLLRALSVSPDYLELIKKFSIERKFRNEPSENLVEALNEAYDNKAYSKALEKLLWCLYMIRNNLFHGIKEPDNERQNELLEESAKILHRILSIILEPYFLDK